MSRYTQRDEYGNADIIGVDSADLQLNLEFKEFNRVTDALNRLAAYEDIGLEPKQVRKIANVLQEIGQEYNCRFEFVAEVVEKYAKYVDAEREGRCVVLPCKVGDVVYMTCTKSVLETKVTEAYISENSIGFSTFNVNKHGIPNYHSFYADKIGKTVFLTRAEAEEAPKGASQ